MSIHVTTCRWSIWGVIEGRAIGALDKDKREEQKAKAVNITKQITAQGSRASLKSLRSVLQNSLPERWKATHPLSPDPINQVWPKGNKVC